MSEMADGERIEALEIRIAYQEQAIEDLTAALAEQWKHIETLQRKFGRLEAEFAEAELAARAGAGIDRPPPHY